MKKYLRFIVLFLAFGLLEACNTSSCTTNVAGCPSSSNYSCPAAVWCYTTKSACEASGECP